MGRFAIVWGVGRERFYGALAALRRWNEPPTYARVGGPPADWYRLQVRDLDSGELVDAVEANSAEGWAVVLRPEQYRPGMPGIPTEHVKGRFAIERQPWLDQ